MRYTVLNQENTSNYIALMALNDTEVVFFSLFLSQSLHHGIISFALFVVIKFLEAFVIAPN